MKDFLYACMASLIIFLSFFAISSFAADDGDYWLQRNISIGDGKNQYGKKVYGSAARSVMESVPIKDSTQDQVRQLIKRSIAADKPTASKVGSSMFKRVSVYAKNPGVQMVGVLAVTELLGAVDWVIKDGAYVKELEKEGPYSVGNKDSDYGTGDTREQACQNYASSFAKNNNSQSTSYVYGTVGIYGIPSPTSPWWCYLDRYVYSDHKPNAIQETGRTDLDKNEEPETIPLTPVLLGAMMMGESYTDPVDSVKYDPIVNTGDYTGVKEIYEHDPDGVGDELADRMDDKLKNAKPTDGNKKSYIGDPAYDDKDLTDGDTSSDRSWTEGGDEATGETNPVKDPETGQATGGQSISLQFPLFCSWASKMCAWYDDWKVSDKVYKDHMKKTEEHQTDEKTFWASVKDWFDWTKEEPESQESEQPEVDDKGIFSRTFDTTFSLSKQCPPDIPINFESTYLSGSFTFSMSWLCIIFSFMAYPLIFLSHCIGIWILYETVTQKEIKW